MGRNRGKHEEENQLEATIKELKTANRRLKSDNERLKSELMSLQEAFGETSKYLKNNTDGISVEKIIEGVKNNKTLVEIKKTNKCEKCGSSEVKELNVPNVGLIRLCSICKNREVVKHGKTKKHEG